MRRVTIAMVVTGGVLAGCHRADPFAADDGSGKRGRYAGIGIYDAQPMWKHMAGVAQPGGSDKAAIADDEHIIVVTDMMTGEVRQCGDHSGLCVSMNPWTAAVPASQHLPVSVTRQAAEMEPAGSATAARKDR